MKWLVLFLFSVFCLSCHSHRMVVGASSFKETSGIREPGIINDNTTVVNPGGFFYNGNDLLITSILSKCRKDCIAKSKYLKDKEDCVAGREHGPKEAERTKKHQIHIRNCNNFCFDQISNHYNALVKLHYL